CMKDIGILSSLDPVAIDQACIDLVKASEDKGRDTFMERVNSRNGLYTIEVAENHGFGSRAYELIEID
ncbi:MAG: ferredoxin, partial [Clostridia bacterium]|nr:ferredoxin [Clostridia bacterium]